MFEDKLFKKFCRERNIKDSTVHGYESALKHYTRFHERSLEELLQEAIAEEDKNIPLKDRKLKEYLITYRNYLLQTSGSSNTVKSYFTKVKTFYRHFEVTIPYLPDTQYDSLYEVNYLDLPTHDHIRDALNICTVDMRCIILFMSSSGTAKAETLSLTVKDFVTACDEYHNGGSLENILDDLGRKDNIVPTFYLRRIKTDKYYYTFCSPEASSEIIKYLKTRPGLILDDKLFDFQPSTLTSRFQEINDKLGWGFKGNYRFFRAHTLRKFHASNIGLTAEYIDELQGRSKNTVHETYIKTNPKELKRIYMKNMDRVMIKKRDDNNVNQEFTIVINVFLSGKEYNIY